MAYFLLVIILVVTLCFLFISSVSCAEFSVEYSGNVYLNQPRNYTYNFIRNNGLAAVRFHINAANATEAFPLMVILKQQVGVLSFVLPLTINNKYKYDSVSRNLCPSFIVLGTQNNNTEQIAVELSSFISDASRAPFYRLRLDILPNFVLLLEKETPLSITPSESQYFLFKFPEGIESVVVRTHSTDKLCMTVSVQEAKCPVADMLGSVKYSGVYQTVTTLGAITVSKQQNISEFLVVLVVKPDDVDCNGLSPLVIPGQRPVPRVKNVTIVVSPTLAGDHYYLPIYGAIGIYIMFYIAAAVVILVYPSYDKRLRNYFGSITGLDVPADRRGPLGMSSSQNTDSSSVIPVHSSFENAVTCARRSTGSRFLVPVSPVLTLPISTSVTSTVYERSQRSVQSHRLFSSSSSSDIEDKDPIHTTVGNQRTKKLKKSYPMALPPTQSTKQQHRRSVSYGNTQDMGVRALDGPVPRCATCSTIEGGKSTNRILPTVQQLEETNEVNDVSPDARIVTNNAYRSNRNLFVSDLSRKRYSTLNRKYLLYFWYLIIISIFYGLPVAQLVMTYQRALHDTGNEDMCYYNFECAHPLGVFTAFNNIISNIGYFMLGLLFLGLTVRRDRMHRRVQKYKIFYSQDAYSMKFFCRWLCSRLRRSNKFFAGGEGGRGGALPPGPMTTDSSDIPSVTITRTKRRRKCYLCNFSLRVCSCCHYGRLQGPVNDDEGTTERNLDNASVENLAGSLKAHLSNDEDDSLVEESVAYGIPQHYGLFYAMGFSLTMEGLLSACYHMCPSFSNFQFDTAYMYILALILMLKIYQTRHPDINASAHSAYMMMAGVILAGVIGVLYGGETFWIIFTVVFLVMSLCLTAEIYYMGQWNFDICLPRRLYHLIRSDGIHCCAPMYLERMLLLLVANFVNIGMAVFGLVTRPRDFSSYLLSIFMINLLMYYIFYVIMKYRFRERFHCVTVLYIVLACLTWGFAIYFFLQRSTTWEVTPAQSRALNQPCIFLGFYDVHDVWHFLSSTSMFFSFMSIMTLDDDLTGTRRNQIPVF